VEPALRENPQRRAALRNILVAAALVVTLLLANAPYAYGYVVRPPGTRFWAVPPINSGDANQYLGFTHIASGGSLLIGDPFTSEPVRPRLFIPVAQFEGLLCRLFRWSPIEAFQASRVLFGAVLLAVAWWFGTLLLRPWRLRWLYLGLLCFSAGASWVLERFGVQIPSGDLLQPEGNTFFTLANLPHLPLSNALLTALFGLGLLGVRGGRRAPEEGTESKRSPQYWGAGGALFCSAVLSWVHPFDFLTLGLGLGSYFLLRWVCDRRFPTELMLHGCLVVLGALPAAGYLFWSG
jgi:hypothetical protein